MQKQQSPSSKLVIGLARESLAMLEIMAIYTSQVSFDFSIEEQKEYYNICNLLDKLINNLPLLKIRHSEVTKAKKINAALMLAGKSQTSLPDVKNNKMVALKIALSLSHKRLKDFSDKLGVSSPAISRCVLGQSKSRRLNRAINLFIRLEFKKARISFANDPMKEAA